MKEFKALVLAHYNFVDKDGKEVKRTKLRVSLNDFGIVELTIPLDESLDILSVVDVNLTYKDNKFRITSVKN